MAKATHYSLWSWTISTCKSGIYVRMGNRKQISEGQGRLKTNEVVLEQHYPSLLARGTTFHPLKLLSVSGVVWELCLTQTTLNFKQIGSAALQATESTADDEFHSSEKIASVGDVAALEQSFKILSPFISATQSIIPFQVVHTLLVSTVVMLLSRNRHCGGRHCSVTKCNKWDSLSVPQIATATLSGQLV